MVEQKQFLGNFKVDISSKADKADVYTKTEINTMMNHTGANSNTLVPFININSKGVLSVKYELFNNTDILTFNTIIDNDTTYSPSDMEDIPLLNTVMGE
jgi:hypothetical protein